MLNEAHLSDDEDYPSPDGSIPVETEHQAFILGYSSANVDLRPFHPLPSQIPFIWKVYCDNIHPLTGLLHIPTMGKTISSVAENLSHLAKSTEALMFAIYYAVITSMPPSDVFKNFGIEKPTLLSRYRFAVEQALARANFLNTAEIVTLQAFVLFLVCVRRHDDSRFVWTLTGLAIRLAQSLGLHRDGEVFNLPPFNVEMRRRLWWQVVTLDVRSSEVGLLFLRISQMLTTI
jgi:hypothetical protein